MAEQKPWDWKSGISEFWLKPSEESHFLAVRWREKGYGTILDLGSGLGRHSVFFAQNGFNVSAIDLSKDGIDHLKQWAVKLDLEIPAVVGYMDTLPYPDAKFDCVFAMNVIYHADKTGVLKTIDEIYRVLKPGGEIFVTFCAKDTPAYVDGKYPQVDEYTVLKTEPPETDIPHFYVDLADIKTLLNRFDIERVRHMEDCIYNGEPVNLSRRYNVLGGKSEE